MGVLDALTILGAGAGRGYRQSQETQRLIAEQKRRALLEEREAVIKEQAAQAQQKLTESQIQTEALNRAIGQFGLDVNKANQSRRIEPVTPNAAPLKLSFLGNTVEVPGDMQSMTDLGALINQLSEESFKSKHPEYYRNYPPVGQTKLEPRARKIDYILRAASVAGGGGPNQFESISGPEAYNTRVAATFNYILGQMKQADPEAFEAKIKALTDSTGVGGDGDTTYFNDPALETGGQPNRFKGIKVKPQGAR